MKVRRLLIANRGEIACRIIRTCQKMGIETVAVYSDADRNSLHRKIADFSQHIGESTAQSSYLDESKIIEVAKSFGVDAIHPGYGFLSEQHNFAELADKSGIKFIGPSSKSLQQLGDKSKAKELATSLNIPTIPGSQLGEICNKALQSAARQVGFPLIIKAACGGGGRGLRIVENEESLLESAQRVFNEAVSFFGEGSLLIEKLVTPAYHIEVQLIGDCRHNVRHLFERDCSLQRRSQKVVEESPAAFVPLETLSQLYNAAEKLGKAAQIESLVTVEFLVSKTNPKEFYFLEANPRIQVEHPVTEMVLGLDLVELQLRIAAGEELSTLLPKQLKQKGHAIEARLYAECPERHFQPSTGATVVSFPECNSNNKRIDHGLVKNDSISTHYDPMIAKLIALEETRECAIETLGTMLKETSTFGVFTNNHFLEELIQTATQDFTHTKAIDSWIENQYNKSQSNDTLLHVATTASFLSRFLLDPQSQQSSTKGCFSYPAYPLIVSNPFSVKTEATFSLNSLLPGNPIAIESTLNSCNLHFKVTKANNHFIFSKDNINFAVNILAPSWGEYFSEEVIVNGLRHVIKANYWTNESDKGFSETAISAPLPGKIVKILISVGDKVETDQPLIVLESMKIEHTLNAQKTGAVKKIHCRKGDAVNANETLLEIEYTGHTIKFGSK